MASAAWIVAGVTSAGGVTAFVVTRLRANTGAKKIPPQPKSKENSS